jgi:hypothetical protein
MEDRLTPTKLHKDWQQLMLGMREDQLAFHDLILGKLWPAQTKKVIATILHSRESPYFCIAQRYCDRPRKGDRFSQQT